MKTILAVLPRVIDDGFEEEILRIYITDSLKIITANTGKAVMNGAAMSRRWIELFTPEETRTADEIITQLQEKLRKAGEEK